MSKGFHQIGHSQEEELKWLKKGEVLYNGVCQQYQLRQENFEFWASLGYIGRPNLPPYNKNKKDEK